MKTKRCWPSGMLVPDEQPSRQVDALVVKTKKGLVCPKCKSNSRVTDTRKLHGNRLKRYRKCQKKSCGNRFYTIERIEFNEEKKYYI